MSTSAPPERRADATDEEGDMEKWQCQACGYIYDPAAGDPENGIPTGTSFEDLPETWTCPQCGVGKEYFQKVS